MLISNSITAFRHVILSYSAGLFITAVAIGALSGCGPRASEQARVLEAQVRVPGTHVLLAPPEHFAPATNFAGFQYDVGEAGIMVTDLAGTDFYADADAFSRQRLEDKGLTVLDYQDTIVGDYLAKYAYLQTTPTTRTHQLTFGDSTFVATVSGLFPAKEEAIGQQIKAALFSSAYQKEAVVAPVATAPFSVDETLSKFKFASAAGSMFAYSPGGKAAPIPGDKAVIMVVPVPTQNEKAADFSSQIMSQLDAAGLLNRKVKNESHQSINGYDAYEAEVYGNLEGVETLMYILYLVNSDQGAFIRGTAPANQAGNLAEFKKFARSLRFKPSR
jgi:hypothetical protein